MKFYHDIVKHDAGPTWKALFRFLISYDLRYTRGLCSANVENHYPPFKWGMLARYLPYLYVRHLSWLRFYEVMFNLVRSLFILRINLFTCGFLYLKIRENLLTEILLSRRKRNNLFARMQSVSVSNPKRTKRHPFLLFRVSFQISSYTISMCAEKRWTTNKNARNALCINHGTWTISFLISYQKKEENTKSEEMQKRLRTRTVVLLYSYWLVWQFLERALRRAKQFSSHYHASDRRTHKISKDNKCNYFFPRNIFFRYLFTTSHLLETFKHYS